MDGTGTLLEIEGATFRNQGTLEAVNSASLAINANDWSNTGTISATDSTIQLGGGFTTAGIGTLNQTDSIVEVTGVLDNRGDTLLFNATTGSWKLNGGTIRQ